MADHWFEDLADHMGEAYLRYSFTKGTVQEVDHIVEALNLSPGDRVLDVGCGPGRHAHELGRRGIEVHGVDISERFVEIARRASAPGVSFERVDARALTYDAEFDAVICLCQGAFGLMTADGDDDTVVAGMSRALKPGGRLALSAFSSYFVVKHWTEDEHASFDAATGVNHERTEVRDADGTAMPAELWTGCYTPRELRLIAKRHGLRVESISSVEPGAYGDDPPTVDTPEFLLVATRAADASMHH